MKKEILLIAILFPIFNVAAFGQTRQPSSPNRRVSTGQVRLERDVPANATIVVEVPLEGSSDVPMTLTGKLTAELDQIVRTFNVSAAVDPNAGDE